MKAIDARRIAQKIDQKVNDSNYIKLISIIKSEAEHGSFTAITDIIPTA